MKNLNTRIQELHEACENVENSLQQHNKERSRLVHEKRSKTEEIAAMEERCENLQLSKYGKIVDLDDLGDEVDRSKEDQLETSIEDVEENFIMYEKKMKSNLLQLEDKLAQITANKTTLLNFIAEINERKLKREKNHRMMKTRDQKFKVYDMNNMKDELDKLGRTSKEQSQNIDSLKVELFMLKRKDTSSLTMPTIILPYQDLETLDTSKSMSIAKPFSSSSLTDSVISNSFTLPPISTKPKKV
jgi:chromosome segregation ATPase